MENVSSRMLTSLAMDQKKQVCRWGDCSKKFYKHVELLKHVNKDHVPPKRKGIVCHWSECRREKKPFKSTCSLILHVKGHTGDRRFKCTFEGCAKAYIRRHDRKIHLRSHTGEKPYMCTFSGCTKAFITPSNRNKHNIIHSKEFEECAKAYRRREDWKIHLRSHTGIYEGERVDDKMENVSSRMLTSLAMDQKKQVCHWEDCSKKFYKHVELVKHVNEDHVPPKRKGIVCHWSECRREKKPFKSIYSLSIHMKGHTGDRRFKCTFEECAKAYCRRDDQMIHLRSHTGEKPYICTFSGCKKTFNTISNRNRHNLSHSKEFEECAKAYCRRDDQMIHLRSHTGEKPYICTFSGCKKTFNTISNRNRHNLSHSKEFEECAKTYRRRADRKIHLRSHTGKKPYMCAFPGCTKAFSTNGNRTRHNKTHSKDEYMCALPGCTKAFSTNGNLRSHTGKKPYMCAFPGCTKAFSTNGSRTRHNQTHSKDESALYKKVI